MHLHFNVLLVGEMCETIMAYKVIEKCWLDELILQQSNSEIRENVFLLILSLLLSGDMNAYTVPVDCIAFISSYIPHAFNMLAIAI